MSNWDGGNPNGARDSQRYHKTRDCPICGKKTKDLPDHIRTTHGNTK